MRLFHSGVFNFPSSSSSSLPAQPNDSGARRQPISARQMIAAPTSFRHDFSDFDGQGGSTHCAPRQVTMVDPRIKGRRHMGALINLCYWIPLDGVAKMEKEKSSFSFVAPWDRCGMR
ncbi:hypothetical protein ACE6H2_003590 [Prunus campanulata]